MNRMHEVALENLRLVNAQEDWMLVLERCIRACNVVPTPDHRAAALPLYKAGSSPYAATAEIGILG